MHDENDIDNRCEHCIMAIPYNPDAKRGDWDYRPGPDWPPTLHEIVLLLNGLCSAIDER